MNRILRIVLCREISLLIQPVTGVLFSSFDGENILKRVFFFCTSSNVCSSLLFPLCADSPTGRHPAAGGPVGSPVDRCSPQRLRSPEEPGVRQSQRRQQDRLEELRRDTRSGPTAEEDHRPGDQGAAHRYYTSVVSAFYCELEQKAALFTWTWISVAEVRLSFLLMGFLVAFELEMILHMLLANI